jgi:hypothetical protein
MWMLFMGLALAEAVVIDITTPTASKIPSIFFIFSKRYLL